MLVDLVFWRNLLRLGFLIMAKRIAEGGKKALCKPFAKSQSARNHNSRQSIAALSKRVVDSSLGDINDALKFFVCDDPVNKYGINIEGVNDFKALSGNQFFFRHI